MNRSTSGKFPQEKAPSVVLTGESYVSWCLEGKRFGAAKGCPGVGSDRINGDRISGCVTPKEYPIFFSR